MDTSTTQANPLVRNWWLVLLRGFAGIIFGVITFIAPHVSLITMVFVFGAYAFIDGVLALVSLLARRGPDKPWPVLLLEAAAGIAAGLITFFRPGITALGLLGVIAAWAFITGVLEIAAAVRLRKVIAREWLLAIAGVVSIALGVLLVVFPAAGLLTVVLWTGAYAFVFGVVLVALAVRLRAWGHPGGSHRVGGAGATPSHVGAR
jgi:uncharacterized membrane protein HdeD (DUF308 family)